MRNFWNRFWSACAFVHVAQLTTAQAYPLINSHSRTEPWKRIGQERGLLYYRQPRPIWARDTAWHLFQLFSTQFSNLYIPEAIADIWISNTIFVVAVFSALLKASVERQLYFAEDSLYCNCSTPSCYPSSHFAVHSIGKCLDQTRVGLT